MRVLSSLVVVLLTTLTCTAGAVCPSFDLPANLSAKEHLFTVGTDMTLADSQGTVGTILQRVFNFGKTFEVYNAQGEKVGSARQEVLSWGVKVNVFDCEDQKIGSLHELVWSSLFKWNSRYEIYDSEDQLIGQSEKNEIFSVEVNFKDLQGRTVALMKSPWPGWPTRSWDISIYDAQAIHPLLLMVAPAYKTSADRDRKNK